MNICYEDREMNKIIILMFFAVLISGIFLTASVNAEKEIEMLIGPYIPRTVPLNEPSDHLMVRDVKNSPVWTGAKNPIEGLDFVEGNGYHIIVKKSDDFRPIDNKKYELVEVKHIFKPHEPYSSKNLCAPGYQEFQGQCKFSPVCSADAYPGRPCTWDVTEQNYLRPLQQGKVDIMPEDIICLDTLQLVLNYDNTPACVKISSVNKLLERGFTLEKNNNISPYEELKDKPDDKEFDIVEVKLFLKKYPQAEVQSDTINESGFHFKQYVYRESLPDGSVWLFLVKNLETGEMDNVISCPPNQNHDRGYIVRGSENIIEYLQNYDCLKDSDVGKFGPANNSFIKVT